MSPRDEDPLVAAERWHTAGRGVALATVVETWGSAPWPAGSALAIDDRGNFLGSVSGGCVEAAVVAEAADVIAGGQPKLLEFGVADETAWDVGLSCGGSIRVYLEKVDSSKLDRLQQFNAERAARRAVVMVTDLDGGTQRLVKATDLGGDPLGSSIAARLGLRRSGVEETTEGRRVFLDVHVPAARLVITGAVHISQVLAPIGRLLGYDVTIVDPRTAFASIARFPDVKVIADWPDVALPPLEIDDYTAFVALTHDPKIDDPALLHALSRNCFYIGALGSKKTHARRVERLRQAGVTDADIARIHAPIGLAIGAVSPAEIAVAIMAQITGALRVQRGKESPPA